LLGEDKERSKNCSASRTEHSALLETPVRELHVAFKFPDMYDYITKLCRTPADVILNHANPNVRGIGQGEARRRKYKRLKLGGGQAYDRSSD
jgi:hypothetical protein